MQLADASVGVSATSITFKGRGKLAIFATACGAAAVVVDATTPLIVLPSIGRELHISEVSTTLIVAIYQLVLVITLMPFAAIAERIGSKRLWLIGQAGFAVASVLCPFVSSFPEILALRVLQALGAGATLACTGAMMRAIYPPERLGRRMGVQATVVSLSMAVAPSIGGFVVEVASWPWAFACAAPLSLLALAAARSLPPIAGQPGRFDWIGASINAAMFGLVMGGLQVVAHGGATALATGLIAPGTVIGVFFVRNQRRQERPILPVDLLGDPVLGLATLAALAAFTASMTVMLSIPFRLETGFGMGAATVGLVLMAYPTMMTILAPVAGTLADRHSPDAMAATGLAIGAVGLTLLGLLPADLHSPWPVVWRMAITGLGFGLFMTPNVKIVIGAIPLHRTASGSSLNALTRMTGQTIGSTLTAVLIGWGLGTSGLPAICAGVLTAVAAALSVVQMRIRARADAPTPARMPACPDQPSYRLYRRRYRDARHTAAAD